MTGVALAPALAKGTEQQEIKEDFTKPGEILCRWRNFLVFASSKNAMIEWCVYGQPIGEYDWRLLPSLDVCQTRPFQGLIPSNDCIYWVGNKEIWRLGWHEDISSFRAQILTTHRKAKEVRDAMFTRWQMNKGNNQDLKLIGCLSPGTWVN